MRQSRLLDFWSDEATPVAYHMLRWMANRPMEETRLRNATITEQPEETGRKDGNRQDEKFSLLSRLNSCPRQEVLSASPEGQPDNITNLRQLLRKTTWCQTDRTTHGIFRVSFLDNTRPPGHDQIPPTMSCCSAKTLHVPELRCNLASQAPPF